MTKQAEEAEAQAAQLAHEESQPPQAAASAAGAVPAVPPVAAPLLVSGPARLLGAAAIELQPSVAPPAQLQQQGQLQVPTASCRVPPQQQEQTQQQQTQKQQETKQQTQKQQQTQQQGQQQLQGQQQRTQQHQQRPKKTSRDPRLPNGGAAAARRLAAEPQQALPMGEPAPLAAPQQVVPSPEDRVPQPTVAQPQGSTLTPLSAPEQGPPRQLSQQQAAARLAACLPACLPACCCDICRGSSAAPANSRPYADGGPEARQPAVQPLKQAVPNRNLASKAPAGTDAGALQPAPLQRQSGAVQATRQKDDGGAVRAAGLPDKRNRAEVDKQSSLSSLAQAVAAPEAQELQQHKITDATLSKGFTPSAARQNATHVSGAPVTQPRGSAQAPQPIPQPPPAQPPQQQASGRGGDAGAANTQRHADDGHEARRISAQPAASRPRKLAQALVRSSPASKAPADTAAGALRPTPLQHRQSPNQFTRQERDGGAVAAVVRAAGLPQKRAHVEVESDKLRMAQVKSAREERRAHKGGKDAPQTHKARRPAADPQGSAPDAATDAAPDAAHGGSAGDRPATAEAFVHG